MMKDIFFFFKNIIILITIQPAALKAMDTLVLEFKKYQGNQRETKKQRNLRARQYFRMFIRSGTEQGSFWTTKYLVIFRSITTIKQSLMLSLLQTRDTLYPHRAYTKFIPFSDRHTQTPPNAALLPTRLTEHNKKNCGKSAVAEHVHKK